MRTDELLLIRALPLFADMAQESFDALMQASFLQRFPPQVVLIREGEPADFLHVVVDGAVELFAAAGRRETTMELVRPISTFILAAVIRDSVYLMSARTLEPSRVLMIPTRSIHDVFARDTAFARSIVVELSTRYRAMVKSLKSQKLRSGIERLANHLLRVDAEQGGEGRILLSVEKRVVAALLGMTPENLSRAFATLSAYGVEVDGPRIVLTKPDDLRRLANPTPLIDDPES
jgi:CRP/FNR family transcriptional regulator, transcriptional activator FtrB